MKLSDSVIKVKGIGQKSAALYEKLDIRTVGDLLCHFPRGYERYEKPVLVRALVTALLVSLILLFGAYGAGYVPVDPIYANF